MAGFGGLLLESWDITHHSISAYKININDEYYTEVFFSHINNLTEIIQSILTIVDINVIIYD